MVKSFDRNQQEGKGSRAYDPAEDRKYGQQFNADGRYEPEMLGKLIYNDEQAAAHGYKIAADRLRECVDFVNAQGPGCAMQVLTGERAAAKHAHHKSQLVLSADGSLAEPGSPNGDYGSSQELRAHLNLPPWASDEQVGQAEAKHASEAVRQYVDLPPWSTDNQVKQALTKQTGSEVRAYLDLPPWAPDSQVNEAERKNIERALREANEQ